MQRAVVTTHYRENYGAHDWDGKGECPQYWKNKGSYEYAIELPDDASDILVSFVLARLAGAVPYANDFAQEACVAREVLQEGEKTSAEKHFDELFASRIAAESDRKHYTPTVYTLASLDAESRKKGNAGQAQCGQSLAKAA